MNRRLGIRGLRGRLLLAVLAAVGAALAGLTVGFNVILANQLDRDAAGLLRSRATSELASLNTVDGRLRVGESPDAAARDSQVWVFAGPRALERPRTSAAIDRAATAFAGTARRTVDVPGADTRLLSVPIVNRGRRLGTVVAAVSLSPYERTRHTALIASLILVGLVLVAVALAARWVLAAALRPVARMTAAAEDWSEHDLDRRFGLGPPRDELTALAATLDRLLGRLAAGIRREQRFSAELSHELRTPLARITSATQLALRDPAGTPKQREQLQLVRRSADQMRDALETLLAAARAEADPARGTADPHAVAAAVAETHTAHAAESGVRIVTAAPREPLRLGVETDVAKRILNPLVENACRYGEHEVRITIQRRGGRLCFAVRDDGPGIAESEREHIFEPGIRGTAAAGSGDGAQGSGLGLALARRLARASGGDVLAASSARGACFEVWLPSG